MKFRFEKLETWQLARTYNKYIYVASGKFPKEEAYGLTNQIRRASVSIASNIAEGSGRNSDKDFGHFLEIAYGSLMETISQSYLALDQKFIEQKNFDLLAEEANLLARKIVSLSNSLGRQSRTNFNRKK